MQTSPDAAFVPDPSLDGSPERAVEPFAPPAEAWRRVSPKLATVRRISLSIGTLIVFGALTVAAWLFVPFPTWPPLVVAGVGLLWWLWRWVRAGRVVRATGWARRDKDLCVVQGLWFRDLSIIPFGRIQMVRVTSGPLLRAFGLANVDVVTASLAANATIPGLPGDEARALRDLIIELSDAEGSGL
ncbi:PH domain-containing protein [Propioniciclava coleopterorum]|uniref:PH domain-containing protein n=1 Tax=Propioniciclava coleopterorum TaxID=2714937 RepID=A0A6G7Y765_9ACTN|nr:PH domain-containing protein [Propioniciclava coleopterorum]QIK72655.1 PH domain-containing protein [Propioniciclava coleopterorum]